VTNADNGEDPDDDDLGVTIPDHPPFSELWKFDIPPEQKLARTFRDGVARVDDVAGRGAAQLVGLLGLAVIANAIRKRSQGS
jgi:hypothetical protein